MKLAVVDESGTVERRVALVPEAVRALTAEGHRVAVEVSAGARAFFADTDYAAAGAVVANRIDTLARADVVLRITPPSLTEVGEIPTGASLITMLHPATSPALVSELAARRIDAYSLDLLPRTGRAQPMDALSSQATAAGYAATLTAARHLPGFFPLLMTAAGTVPPAKVFVVGTGVAGLQAIATARRLGAVVSAHDVRAAAREEVASLGATFVDLGIAAMDGAGGYARAQSTEFLDQQRELLTSHLSGMDAVVTTAAVPGRRAPVLITADMVAAMRPGSVVVDAAVDSGGNCALAVPGEITVHGTVTVIGLRNPASLLPRDASTLYARNLTAFLRHLLAETAAAAGGVSLDDIVAGTRLTHRGEVVHPLAKQALGLAPAVLEEER
jgi:NAD(P) transhydrogenase subunit alpha